MRLPRLASAKRLCSATLGRLPLLARSPDWPHGWQLRVSSSSHLHSRAPRPTGRAFGPSQPQAKLGSPPSRLTPAPQVVWMSLQRSSCPPCRAAAVAGAHKRAWMIAGVWTSSCMAPQHDDAVLEVVRRRKQARYPELAGPGPQCLVVRGLQRAVVSTLLAAPGSRLCSLLRMWGRTLVTSSAPGMCLFPALACFPLAVSGALSLKFAYIWGQRFGSERQAGLSS